MRLLYRFFEPKSGEILIAGQSIKDLDLDCLRKAISVVPQVSTSSIFNQLYTFLKLKMKLRQGLSFSVVLSSI